MLRFGCPESCFLTQMLVRIRHTFVTQTDAQRRDDLGGQFGRRVWHCANAQRRAEFGRRRVRRVLLFIAGTRIYLTHQLLILYQQFEEVDGAGGDRVYLTKPR